MVEACYDRVAHRVILWLYVCLCGACVYVVRIAEKPYGFGLTGYRAS